MVQIQRLNVSLSQGCRGQIKRNHTKPFPNAVRGEPRTAFLYISEKEYANESQDHKKGGYLRGNIYYAAMEPHIGSEQGGKRPVVVLQNNIGNRHSPTLIVATVTTRTEKKKKQPTHVLVDSNPAFEEPSMILLEQIFTIDKSRIERFMGYASKAEMLRIDMALLVSLALNVLSGNRSE